ncbi:glutamate ABC transporter substrate-binding protein [Nocardioides sp. JQ2195]|uniref:glutamate ABC transporter substrate-binding protein n=1 Tax=Nocardioides sp. JQ2195 TaxID=2592334 RepID=UPI00143E8B57|nr:glutamate ABC transporter substrate-binding protein [Nocardioides sp. JQ2195]QIX27986.1 glutamate ABC transporter substrate-binding protein [Nocardioides sp. JQ2195]
MRATKWKAALIVASLALSLSACGEDKADEGVADVEDTSFDAGTTMAKLQDAGKITIGTKFDQPLFGLKGPDGDPEGFDVEMGKIIAAKLGIEAGDIEWVATPSEIRETSISDGRVDIVIATYTINDDRKKLIDFAGPYFNAGQMLMVTADNDEISSVDDLDGKTVCSARGSTPAQNIKDNYPKVKLELPAEYSDCLEPLRNGQVDALTTDNVILSGYVAQNEGDFKLVGDPFTEEPYGIGLKKGDDEFRDFLNDVIEESYDNGEWEDAWEKTAGTVLDLPAEFPKVDRY